MGGAGGPQGGLAEAIAVVNRTQELLPTSFLSPKLPKLRAKPERVYNVEGEQCYGVVQQGLPVHSGGANPNLSIVQASPSLFEAMDSTDNQFIIKGAIAAGLLRFTVVARLSNGQGGAVSGKEFFDAMMAHFQSKFVTIEGRWIAGIDLDTNIQEFNYWTNPSGGNLADQDAAKKTWTGERAADHRFNNVTIIFKDPPNAPGSYIEVIVHFTR